ncbi:MAG: alanine racemase [Pseudanabaena sp. ELA607]|jgi:alanine racemase
MLKQNHRAWVEIDLAAIDSNVRQFKALLRRATAMMAVVKADGYGHGAIDVSQTALAAGATYLGVATIPEGIQLRQAGITAPIVILGATNSPDEIMAIAEYRLSPTIGQMKQALVFNEVLAKVNDVAPLPIHAKIDTGMTRLGVNSDEAVAFIQLLHHLPRLRLAGIYSHFATADDPDPTIMQQQHQQFSQVIAQLQGHGLNIPALHICNTAGMLMDQGQHHDMVRLGLGIYGLYPAPHLRSKVKLRPAMSVRARISQVKDIAAGTGISYGRSFVASDAMRVATVAIGYADGVPRGLSNRLRVSLHNKCAAQLGTITMDQCMIDVTHIPEAQVGDVVTFLGTGLGSDSTSTADDWAQLLGTISWEILCGFKHRLPRINIHVPQSGNLITPMRY